MTLAVPARVAAHARARKRGRRPTAHRVSPGSDMGEVAVAVEAFREQFDAGIQSLTPDVAVRPIAKSFPISGSFAPADLQPHRARPFLRFPHPQTLATSWKQQQRVGELCDRLRTLVPAHVWCDTLLQAGEHLLERGQHELARRKCFTRVADANLLDDRDERWKLAKEKDNIGPTDRRRMHVLALFGRARCEDAMDTHADPNVIHPQTLARAKRTLVNLREATQEAYRGDESLYWLVYNGTVHIHGVCERLARDGHSGDAVESLIFAVACLEAHVLLAVPRYLDWRLTLVSNVCDCYDDIGGCETHAAAFLAKCVEHVDDLKQLEALDPVPQTPEVAALYAEAERKFRVLHARYDDALGDAGSITAKMETTDGDACVCASPGDKARFLIGLLDDPSRRTVKRAAPEGKAAAAMEAAAQWLGPLAEAMTLGLKHAAAVRAAADALNERLAAEAEAGVSGRETTPPPEEEGEEGAPPAEETKEGEGEGAEEGDAPPDPTKPPPDLEPEAQEGYEAAVAELPLALHDALMRRAFCYESLETFKLLHDLAALRLVELGATGEDGGYGTDALALAHAAALLKGVRVMEGGEEFPEPEPETPEAPADEREAEEDAEDEKARKDPRVKLAMIIRSLPNDAAASCADIVTDASLMLWNGVKDWFKDTARETTAKRSDEIFAAEILAGCQAGFELVGFDDGALRATISLRLCLALERRGDVVAAAHAAEEATRAIETSRRAHVDLAVGSEDEAVRNVTAECVWLSAADDDGGDAAVSAVAFERTSTSETEQALASLHADLLAAHHRLAIAAGMEGEKMAMGEKIAELTAANERRTLESTIYGVKSAWDLKRETSALERAGTVPHAPAATEERLIEEAGRNPWRRAVLLTQMAASRPKREAREALLEEAAESLVEGERIERELHASATRAKGEKMAKRSLVPRAPLVLTRTDVSVTLTPPELQNSLRSAIRGREHPEPATFAVLAKVHTSGLAPGLHNVDLPGAGVKLPADGSVERVTITGLTPNERYVFSVVAYDDNGEVIGGPGIATDGVVCMHPLPGTTLWSNLAVAASRLGCLGVAKRAAGTVSRRFVDTRKAPRFYYESHPMSTQKLRGDLLAASTFPTMRAVARSLLVAAECALASRMPERPGGDPPIPKSVPEVQDQVFRLKCAKKILMAMELARYVDDVPLTQEIALRLGNCLAPLLVSSRKSRLLVTALAQCVTQLRDSGAARYGAVARLSASLLFELASIARDSGERGVLGDAASLALDSLEDVDLSPNPEKKSLEQFLLSLPEWRDLASDALTERVAAAESESASDPCAAVLPKIPVDGAKAAFDALEGIGEDIHKHEEYLRAFSRIASAAVAQGLEKDLPGWTESVLGKFKAATAVAPVEYQSPPEEEAEIALPEDEEARVAALEAAAESSAETLAAAEETLAKEDATDEEKAAAETQKGEAEAAKAAADGARDAAMARAERREKAARTLTRKLPPMFARRNAALAARPVIASNSPWHAAVHTTVGLVEHEQTEDKVRAEGLPDVPEEEGEAPEPKPEPAEGEEPTADGGEEGGEEVEAPPPPPPPPALDAMRSLARGVELASRVGAHGRLMNAARAMHTLARSPICGVRADARLGALGGARLLSVAAARLIEHLEKLRSGTVDESPMAAVDGGATRAPIEDEGDRLREERTARFVESQPPREREPPPLWFHDRPGVAPEFCLRFVVTAMETCAAAGMHHRAVDLAVGITEVLGTNEAAAAALPLAVASARRVAETLPEGMLDGLEKSTRVALKTRPKPIAALADARSLACIDGETYARRGPATRTLRTASARDLERNFSLFWNGINEPDATGAYFGAEITLPPSGFIDGDVFKAPAGAAPLSHEDAVEAAYARAVSLARVDNDRDAVAQALLELGDFKAKSGDLNAAAFHWGACVDQITGCYCTVTTAGGSATPGDPEACLRTYGLWGCLRGAVAAARLAAHGGRGAGELGAGHRVEAARISAALFAAPFASTLSHSPRAKDIVGGHGLSPPELWDGVDACGSDPYRFDARIACDLSADIGDVLVASGRPLEALPALAVAEHLAAHALRDARTCARVRCAQASALSSIGRFDAAAERIAALLAGDGFPSTATGADGKIIRTESGAAVTRPESVPAAVSFDVSLPAGAEANKPAIECVSSGEIPDEVSELYGDEVCAELTLTRARWLTRLATPLAEWRGDTVDAVTGEPVSEPDASVDVNARADLLRRAENLLKGLLESTLAAAAAAAAAEQTRIDAHRAKVAEAREARETARAAKADAEKAEREANATAEKDARDQAERETEDAYEAAGPYPIPVKKPATDPTPAATNGGSDAENADPNTTDGGAPTQETEGAKETEGAEEPPLDLDDEDDEDVVAKDVEEGETKRVISAWICATPVQLSILARAHAALASVLRAQHRPRAAFDEATAAARELESVGDGAPAGVKPNGSPAVRARDALEAIAHVGGAHALWLDLRAECALCLLDLGQLEKCAEHAGATANAARRLGSVDHARLCDFVAARAAAESGDVDTACARYDAILAEMTAPQSPEGDGSPPPTPAFLASVAGTAAELRARLGDYPAAEARLRSAADVVRSAADALGLPESLRYPDARNPHNPAVGVHVKLLRKLAEVLCRQGLSRHAEAGALLDEAASLRGTHTAATDARLHAEIAILRGHVARRAAVGGDGFVDATHHAAAEKALTAALRWSCAPDAGHDRVLIRACLLELAATQVPDAAAEATGAKKVASPDDAKATARLVACLKHAAKAAKMRDAFAEAHAFADAAEGTSWPEHVAEAAAEEEEARDADRGHPKLEGADAPKARLVVRSFVRLVGRLPAIGLFAPGSDLARSRAAAVHSALIESCDAYKTQCCFEETPALPPADGVEPAGVPEEGAPPPRVVESGTVAAQWHEPTSEPPGFRRKKSDAGKRPVSLVFVVDSGDEAVAAVAGEVSFDVKEVREMQRAVKVMRKELVDAGEGGVAKERADAFLKRFAEFIEGPAPPDPKRSRGRVSTPMPEDGGKGDGEEDANDEGGDPPGDEPPVDEEAAGDETQQPPAMTTEEDAALFSALEAFVSPDGGFVGVNPALCALLHPALAKRVS